jgi:hypothetical protein
VVHGTLGIRIRNEAARQDAGSDAPYLLDWGIEDLEACGARLRHQHPETWWQPSALHR